MLRKLMKHELRATSRTMLPLFGVILLLSLGLSVMLRMQDTMADPNAFTQVLLFLVSTGYAIALGAVFIVVLVLMINRFRSNLLGDEGYVMFTLPTSIHQLVWSKVIISCLWFAATILIVTISAIIVAVDGSFLSELRFAWGALWDQITAYYALNGAMILVEILILFFISYAGACMQFYFAMAVGHSFDRRKTLYSIITFFVTQFIVQLIVSVPLFSGMFNGMNFQLADTMSAVHLVFGVCILLAALYCAVFYFATTYMLQKRLNIE